MTDFDALLKRSYAEAPEPADDGFSVNVAHAVERREASLKVRNWIQNAGIALGAAAASYGLYAFFGAFGQDLMATAGLEVARVHGALSSAPSVSGVAESASQGVMQSLGAGMTQLLLITAALAGGAVAYRATQD